jgi:hypothetical protein
MLQSIQGTNRCQDIPEDNLSIFINHCQNVLVLHGDHTYLVLSTLRSAVISISTRARLFWFVNHFPIGCVRGDKSMAVSISFVAMHLSLTRTAIMPTRVRI